MNLCVCVSYFAFHFFAICITEFLCDHIQFSDEVKYIKSSVADRSRQLQELHLRLDESMVVDSNQKKTFKDEIQSSLIAVLASDNKRRDSFQLSKDEEQQVVAVSMQFFIFFLKLF